METTAAVWAEIGGRQLRRAAAGTGERPGSEAIPVIFAGVVDGGGGQIGGRAVLQILVEERQHHVLAELGRGVAIPFERAERAPFAIDLAVAPRPHDKDRKSTRLNSSH